MALGDELRKKLKGKPLVAKHDWKCRPEILLQPQVPKPLHRLAPRTLLGSKWWNETRQAAYSSTDYHCQACGIAKHLSPGRKLLDCHEIYEINYAKARAKFVGVAPLCDYCHSFIHLGRLRALMEKGEVTQAHYIAVVQHGDRVLRAAGLRKPSQEEQERAYVLSLDGKPEPPWSAWRLVIGRRLYAPLFANYEEWEKAHA